MKKEKKNMCLMVKIKSPGAPVIGESVSISNFL